MCVSNRSEITYDPNTYLNDRLCLPPMVFKNNGKLTNLTILNYILSFLVKISCSHLHLTINAYYIFHCAITNLRK